MYERVGAKESPSTTKGLDHGLENAVHHLFLNLDFIFGDIFSKFLCLFSFHIAIVCKFN